MPERNWGAPADTRRLLLQVGSLVCPRKLLRRQVGAMPQRRKCTQVRGGQRALGARCTGISGCMLA